jgi:hypothetical protein
VKDLTKRPIELAPGMVLARDDIVMTDRVEP